MGKQIIQHDTYHNLQSWCKKVVQPVIDQDNISATRGESLEGELPGPVMTNITLMRGGTNFVRFSFNIVLKP